MGRRLVGLISRLLVGGGMGMLAGGCAGGPGVRVDEGVSAPASMSWLIGDWRAGGGGDGGGDGEVSQELWSAPLADGTLLGVFRSVKGGRVSFIELMTISTDDDGAVRLRLKHFGPDLRGWEPADAAAAWTLERSADRLAVFRREITGGWEELTYRAPDARSLHVGLRVSKDGRLRELEYTFAR